MAGRVVVVGVLVLPSRTRASAVVPLREYVMLTASPALWDCTWVASAAALATLLPSTAVITSPACSPASAAGLPALTSATCAPPPAAFALVTPRYAWVVGVVGVLLPPD